MSEEQKQTIKPLFYYFTEGDWMHSGYGPLPPERDFSQLSEDELKVAQQLANEG